MAEWFDKQPLSNSKAGGNSPTDLSPVVCASETTSVVSTRRLATRDGESIDFSAKPTDFSSSAGSFKSTADAAVSPPAENAAKKIDWASALRESESWLRTVIAARVGEAQAIEEIFQEVAMAAVRQKAPIEDPTKVGPWLYRLAVTQSLLYRRKIGRRKKLIGRYQEKIPIAEHDLKQGEPIDWLLAEERKTMVNAAMATLPKNLQELLLLKYIHDWSYKEMADKLGTTVSAVQARLHRARGLLRERLAHQVSEEDLG